jgi:hypothetical protein
MEKNSGKKSRATVPLIKSYHVTREYNTARVRHASGPSSNRFFCHSSVCRQVVPFLIRSVDILRPTGRFRRILAPRFQSICFHFNLVQHVHDHVQKIVL